MDLINTNEPDCISLQDRLKRLPRKQLKFWIDAFPVNSSIYYNTHIKYGSLLSLPDGLTENTFNSWAMTCNTNLTQDTRYTGYVVNSYNTYLNEILGKFNIYINPNIISRLNYLLTNINRYISNNMTASDIQTAIWILLKQNNCGDVCFNSCNVEYILKDVKRHGKHFVPSKPTDYVAVFLMAANQWPSTDITLFDQSIIIPLIFGQFHPTGLPCTLIEWGTYPQV